MRYVARTFALLCLLACASAPPRWEKVVGDVYRALLARDYETADAYADGYLDSLSFYGDDHPYRARGLQLKAEIAFRAGRHADAAALSRRALEIQERSLEPDDPRIGESLLALGRAQVRLGRYDEAEETLERALALRTHQKRPDYWTLDEIHYWLGLVARGRGDLAEAERRMARAVPGPGAPWRLSIPEDEGRREYANVLRELGHEGVAARVEGRTPDTAWPETYLGETRLYARSGRLVRWPRERMPLRVHLPPPPDDMFEDPGHVHEVVRRAVTDWSDVVEPGLPSFRFVEHRRGADLRFRWVDPSRGVHLALTRFAVASWDGEGSFVRWIDVAGRYTEDVEAPPEQLYGIVLHEMGHALGLAGHSPKASDLMYGLYDGEPVGIGPRDRATLRALYALEENEAD